MADLVLLGERAECADKRQCIPGTALHSGARYWTFSAVAARFDLNVAGPPCDRGHGRAAVPTIMVIDDDAGVRQGLQVRLKSAGFDVLTAAHPEQAISVVMRERPDLILLDIDMPNFTGLDFHESLLVSRRAGRIPIVYLSGTGTPPNREDAFRQGARAFIAKPYDAHELVATIRGVLAGEEAARRRAQEADAPVSK